MAVSGRVTPEIAPMSEIPTDTKLQLAPGAELTFLHYGRCKLVTVAGGTVSIGRTEYTAEGNVTAEKDGPCPRVHQLRPSGGTVAGGLVMRGGALPRWPLDPEILIGGSGSDRLQTAAIYAENKMDKPLTRLEVSGHRLYVPAGGERLAPNGRYVLRLTMAGGGKPLDLPFIGTAPDGAELLVVLRGP